MEELDTLEATERTCDLADEQARQLVGVPDRRGDEQYLTTEP